MRASVQVANFTWPGEEIVDQVRPLAGLGFDHVIFNVYDDYQGTPVERLGSEVLSALAELWAQR